MVAGGGVVVVADEPGVVVSDAGSAAGRIHFLVALTRQ